jgi:hypothetical protein
VDISTLVTLASDAAIQADAAKARADRLKAAAVAEAERIRLTTGGGDRWRSDQGLGTLRLDGVEKPATPVITDPAQAGSWLAEHAPQTVTCTITVPADQLPDALQALEFASITGIQAAASPNTAAAGWLTDSCVLQAAETGGWDVIHVAADKTTTLVPGVSGQRPRPRWVLSADTEKKRHAVELAVVAAEADLSGLADVAAAMADEPAPTAARPALTVVPEPAAAPADRAWTAEELDLLDLAGLRHVAKEQGVRVSGNKRDLRSRLLDHFARHAAVS